MSSPTSRSLQRLKELGYDAQVVERFNAHVPPHGIRIDLFGLADVEAIADDHTLYVQATPASNLAAHVQKCLDEPRLRRLIACPARVFEIWSWSQKARRRPWVLRRYRATLEHGELAFAEDARAEDSPMDVQASAVGA
jgi:hypothetical protein